MKRFIPILCVVFFVFHAAAQKKGNKIAYEFPKEMAADVKAEYLKMCEKGQVLYDLNCGGCHTTYEKGRKIVPQFSEEEMEAYKIRVLNPKHEENLPETTVTSEELSLIMTFFTYKKPGK